MAERSGREADGRGLHTASGPAAKQEGSCLQAVEAQGWRAAGGRGHELGSIENVAPEDAPGTVMQGGGNGVRAEPEKNACKRKVQAGMRRICTARARMQEGRKRREGKGAKKGSRRLSALGSQDALVKARRVGHGMDADAIPP